MTKVAKLFLVLFVIIEVLVNLAQIRGPFFDEGIYNLAGLRWWEGHGYSDGYLVWFSGSLFWPALAGAAYTIGGLVATRLLALACVTGSCIAVLYTTTNLFGRRASTGTMLALFTYAPLWVLGQQAVHDTVAIFCMCLSFLSISMLLRTGNRLWVVTAAIAFTIGSFSKYPFIAMSVILLAIIWVERRQTFWQEVGLFVFVSACILLAAFLPVREQMGTWLNWTVQNKPAFGVDRPTIVYAQALFMLLPLIIGGGAFLFLRGYRWLTLVLLGAGIMWPLYHIVSGNPVSDWKHATLGFLFLAPVIGVAWTRWARQLLGIVVVGLMIGIGTVHALVTYQHLTEAWPEVRPGAEFLVKHVQLGDNLLIDDSWPYTMYLYAADKIEGPWVVFDPYRINHGESLIGLCEYDWFSLEVGGSYTWSEVYQEAIKQCGFQPVFSFDSDMVGLASDTRYYRVVTTTTIFASPEILQREGLVVMRSATWPDAS